jgi:formate-dependent nitrite reductase membrane component NrfD
VAGVPLALLMAGYTGVLLSGRSTPAWSKKFWLGPLFSASAISTWAAAISLALHARGLWDGFSSKERAAGAALEAVDLAAHVAEALALRGYLKEAGSLAKPLTRGEQAWSLWGGVLGMAGAEVGRLLPLPGRAQGWGKLADVALGLAGGFALRWAFVHAGRASGNDPEAARQMSRHAREGGA